jgi:hypothetical protein
MWMKPVILAVSAMIFAVVPGQARADDIVLACKVLGGEFKFIINDSHVIINGEVKQLLNNKPIELTNSYILFYTTVSESTAWEWTIDRATGKIIGRDYFIKDQRRGEPGGPGYAEGSCEKGLMQLLKSSKEKMRALSRLLVTDLAIVNSENAETQYAIP